MVTSMRYYCFTHGPDCMADTPECQTRTARTELIPLPKPGTGYANMPVVEVDSSKGFESLRSIATRTGILHDLKDVAFKVVESEMTIADAMRKFPRPKIPQRGISLLPAFRIAVEVHGAQTDLQGCPYLFHVFRVAMAMKTDEERVVAMLHDVMEDGGVEWHETIRVEYGDTIAQAVLDLTRSDDTPYSEYVRGLAVNPLAVRVKIQDLRDNVSDDRLRKLAPEQIGRLVNKYVPALEYLEAL